MTPAMVEPDRPYWDLTQPFTANVPRDPARGLSPHDGPAKEPRRIEPPALRLCEGARPPSRRHLDQNTLAIG